MQYIKKITLTSFKSQRNYNCKSLIVSIQRDIISTMHVIRKSINLLSTYTHSIKQIYMACKVKKSPFGFQITDV